MPFITEIPAAHDIEMWQLHKLLRNEYTTWTVDKARGSFLIFARETENSSNYPSREDYYFHHDGKTGVVSCTLHLEKEGNVLIYQWKMISSYGLAYSLQSDPQFLMVEGEDTQLSAHIFAEPQGQEVLNCLREAFLAYKASLGLEDGATQRVIFDAGAILADEPPA